MTDPDDPYRQRREELERQRRAAELRDHAAQVARERAAAASAAEAELERLRAETEPGDDR